MIIPLLLSNEHATLQETVRELLAERFDLTAAVEPEHKYEHSLWSDLSEMGLTALVIPEPMGGAGYGPLEAFLTFREMGRALLASPFFATVALAANVLLHAGDERHQTELLPRIARGELTAALAICEAAGSWKLADIAMRAEHSEHGYRLSGTKHFVVNGRDAGLLLVLAHADDGLAVFAVEPSADGLMMRNLETLDLTRPQADLHLSSTPAVRVSPPGDSSDAVQQALDAATLALLAEQVGGAEHVLAQAVDYAKVRVQFGQPIGGFQAIKHKLAEMAFDLECMISAGWHAAQAVAAGDKGSATALHLAKAFCSESYFRLAAENIQVHGGIGFTWEHSAHLYFRRAKSSEIMLGSPGDHREALLHALTIEG